MSDPATIVQHALGGLDRGFREERKRIQIRKEEVKVFLLIDDIILHIENPNTHTHTTIRANK